MAIIVRDTGDDLRRAITFTRADFQAVGQLIRDAIIDRTERGVQANGQRFKPYSQLYAAQRSHEGYDTNTVNLQVSGEMLRAIKIDATDSSVVVYY